MKAIYKFNGYEDVIIGKPINKHKFELFKNELIEINTRFNLSIYLYGSYVSYLQNHTKYNDINFFILGKKIMEMQTLVSFLKIFHSLAKKHNLVYDICYGANLTPNNIDFSGKTFNNIKAANIELLRLYKNITLNGKNKFNKNLPKFENSGVFLDLINDRSITPKVIRNNTTKTKFGIPIKII